MYCMCVCVCVYVLRGGGGGGVELGRDREEMRALCALLPGRHLQHVSSCLLASRDHRRPWNALSSGNLLDTHK